MANTLRFLQGRENLSATVYVPYDCQNACPFCSSKKEYKCNKDPFRTLAWLEKLKHSTIKEIVFTGGEPMSNIDALKMMVNIVSNKDVYINTSYINTNREEFVDFVNKTPCIKGVNISRHYASFDEDQTILNDIAIDLFIMHITKPVRINVVEQGEGFTEDFVNKVLARWRETKVTVHFRANYNKITQETLHSLTTPEVQMFCDMGEFEYKSSCDVCDTLRFVKKGLRGSTRFVYHRGVPTTAIKFGNNIQINDVIVFPDGELAYDWDRKADDFEVFLDAFKIKEKEVVIKVEGTKPFKLTPPLRVSGSDCGARPFKPYYGSSCGVSTRSSCSSGGCGM